MAEQYKPEAKKVYLKPAFEKNDPLTDITFGEEDTGEQPSSENDQGTPDN